MGDGPGDLRLPRLALAGMSARIPAGWPADRPLAVSVSVMLEGWAEGSAPGVGPMGNVLRPGVVDLQGRSWAEYGAKVGARRILDILGRAGLRGVFYTSGVIAERHPDLPRDIAAAGHRVAAHGFSQATLPPYLTPEQEEADIAACARILAETAGTAPAGWLSPRCTPSAETSRLLAEAGFRWHADSFDSDLPYRIETASGPILGMPFTMEVNDMPLYVRYGNEPEAFARVLERIVAGWPRLGLPFACLDITVHAHVFGRPYGALAFMDALETARRAEWCWMTDHAALAALEWD
ncbi:MAG: polysaccharide deacetylase family protein [Rhodospirillales bacterium]|nr:polysaccharide deacetylase family protein [Rhodospirillales bacterium]